jgi:hypothetical protein
MGREAVVTDSYPRETKEYIHPVVTVDGVGVTAGVVIAIVPDDGTRPTSWTTPDIVDSKLAVMIDHLATGYYRVFAQITDSPEIPVVDCGDFRIT